MTKVSIAMTTYNGEKFVEQQLLSLLNQTRQPDEVIICDDCSTDRTIAIMANFINSHGLQDKWKIIINENNKGLTRNFLDCASMTTGDIIFFSDQDDEWMDSKISKMTNLFENREKVKAMSCSFSTVDRNGNKSDSTFNKLHRGNGGIRKNSFTKQVRDNRSAGLTLAISRELLNYAKPTILKHDLPFDLPMGLFASAFNGYYILKEPLVLRRIHSQNLSAPKYTLKSRIDNIDYHISGRSLKLHLIMVCALVLDDQLSNNERLYLRKTIKSSGNSLLNLKKGKITPLFLDMFSINPMMNSLVSVTNFLCAVFGDYPKMK